MRIITAHFKTWIRLKLIFCIHAQKLSPLSRFLMFVFRLELICACLDRFTSLLFTLNIYCLFWYVPIALPVLFSWKTCQNHAKMVTENAMSMQLYLVFLKRGSAELKWVLCPIIFCAVWSVSRWTKIVFTGKIPPYDNM